MIAPDKALHLLAGAAVALVVYAVGLTTIRDHAALAGLLAAVLIGLVKEGVDHWENLKAARADKPLPHNVEVMDVVFTGAGGAVVFITANLKHWL